MSERTYIGIENHDSHSWHVVVLTEQGAVISGIFENTHQDISAFSQYLSQHCIKPKICLKWKDAGVLQLISIISTIPDVEVIIMSEAGFRLHNNWMSHSRKEVAIDKTLALANQLAHCAKRLI